MYDVSNYRAFSIGVVVSDKAFDSDMIIVSPLETLSIQKEGLINPKTETPPPEYRSSKDTITQDHFELEYWSTNTVEAKWKPIGNTNRKTAPDMVANELVMLYKYGNEDEYYWSEYDDAKEMKKLERVTARFSNRPGGYFEKATLDDDNSYSVTISTKDKLVHIHTADNDGEVTTWDITLNTEAGILNIVDGLGNKFEWDAGAGTLVETFNTRITRNAPLIEDNCETYVRTATNITDNSKDHTRNSTNITDNSETHTRNSTNITDNSETHTRNSTNIADNSETHTSNSTNITDNSETYTSNSTNIADNSETHTRNSTNITDNCENYIRNTTNITDNSDSQTNKSGTILQDANVITTGNHDVSGRLSIGGRVLLVEP